MMEVRLSTFSPILHALKWLMNNPLSTKFTLLIWLLRGKTCKGNPAIFYTHLKIIIWFDVQCSNEIFQCIPDFLTSAFSLSVTPLVLFQHDLLALFTIFLTSTSRHIFFVAKITYPFCKCFFGMYSVYSHVLTYMVVLIISL